jgi:hypothetical protein
MIFGRCLALRLASHYIVKAAHMTQQTHVGIY